MYSAWWLCTKLRWVHGALLPSETELKPVLLTYLSPPTILPLVGLDFRIFPNHSGGNEIMGCLSVQSPLLPQIEMES
jgi:hypothetical protein